MAKRVERPTEETSTYSKHKVRYDRGRMWYASVQAIFTAIFVKIFDLDASIIFKVLAALILPVFIYFIGYADDLLGLLSKEQKKLADKHPYWVELMNNIEKIRNDVDDIKKGNNNS